MNTKTDEGSRTAGPVDCIVRRPASEGTGRASACGLTECAGKPECPSCKVHRQETNGWPRSSDERHLRRLLAVRVGMPHTYYDDGEAQGQEHGISIDFLREPVADIDAKLRALNVARAECVKPPNL
jgi:hypothetical protein